MRSFSRIRTQVTTLFRARLFSILPTRLPYSRHELARRRYSGPLVSVFAVGDIPPLSISLSRRAAHRGSESISHYFALHMAPRAFQEEKCRRDLLSPNKLGPVGPPTQNSVTTRADYIIWGHSQISRAAAGRLSLQGTPP